MINNKNAGFTMPFIIAMILAFSIVFIAVSRVITTNFELVGFNIKQQKALNIAEAGINYYLWHLSHDPTDMKDGNSTPTTPDPELGFGPYVHDYRDTDGKLIGSFTLWIKSEQQGGSVAKVRSIGKLNGLSDTRAIEATIGTPSFASYSVLSDSDLWFGNTEQALGPVHSNTGVRMDGFSNSDVTSANTQYRPSTRVGGDGYSHPGVWCKSTVTSPVDCNTRDKTNWRYPVEYIDFNSITTDLCDIKQAALNDTSANACASTPTSRTPGYIPRRSYTYQSCYWDWWWGYVCQTNTTYDLESSRGYLIILKGNNTYDLYRVDNESATQTTWQSALNETLIQSDISIPANDVIFVEDNLWIMTDPATNFSGRVTIASARQASPYEKTNIKIVDDVKYSTKNGSDAIGLIAEDSVYIAPYAPALRGTTNAFTFEVNAAIIAQSGSVMHPLRSDYGNSGTCNAGWVQPNQVFKFYGSISVRQTWTWIWYLGSYGCGYSKQAADGNWYTGVYNNITEYDYNLLFNPPPFFPVTNSFNILSWREVLAQP